MFKNLDDRCWVIGWIVFGAGILGSILLSIEGFSDGGIMGIVFLAAGFIASWLIAMPFFVFSQLLERSEDFNNKMIKMKSEVALLSKRISEVIGSEVPEGQE